MTMLSFYDLSPENQTSETKELFKWLSDRYWNIHVPDIERLLAKYPEIANKHPDLLNCRGQKHD